MDTFDVVRDVVFDEDPWIILREENLAEMRKSAKKEKNASQAKLIREAANGIEQARKDYADKLRAVTVTIKKPTPALRIEIRSACREDGEFNPERQPLEACKTLIESWDLQGADGKVLPLEAESIENCVPLALIDAWWGEIQVKMYPGQARMGFLAPWAAW